IMIGGVDILVNNAGFDLYGGLEDTTMDQFSEQMDTNFVGAVRVIKAVLPLMRRQGFGRIINISSLGGQIGLPMNSAYAASKFALEGFSESLRLELLPNGIFVSLIEPQAVSTDTLESSIRFVSSPYGPFMERTSKIVAMMRAEGKASPVSPGQVAMTVLRTLQESRPELRYPVGMQARWLPLMKAILPQSIFEHIMVKRFP
ncbi:MAG: SDR family NAD(P)-dependent oxidoreductase, partial [Microcystis panniformis]